MTTKLRLPEYNYEIQMTDLRKNKYYYSMYIVGLNLVFNGIIPFTLLIILNMLLYKRLKLILSDTSTYIRASSVESNQPSNLPSEQNGLIKNNMRRLKASEIVLAKVSIFIVFVFILCHSVRWIPNIYELIQRMYQEDEKNIHWPSWIESITHISHFLTVFNSSVNFYIYCLTHYGVPSKICFLHNQRDTNIKMNRIMSRRKTITCDVESDLPGASGGNELRHSGVTPEKRV